MHIRRHLRFAAHGHAVMHGIQETAIAELVNVSLGGALLLVDARAEVPARNVPITLDLRLAGSDRWFTVPAQVLRHDQQRAAVAVSFTKVESDLEDAIAEVVLEYIEAADSPRVLLCDADETRRRRFARLLRLAGSDPIEAATPLDAIRICEESTLAIAGAVVVAGDPASPGADVLARFLAATYPGTEVTTLDPTRGNVLDDLRLVARAARMI